jgi:GntR family transcriptional regulator, transcriptional repressor for pyruvate dehydrogenase complex
MKLPTIGRQIHLPTRVANLITREIQAGRLKPGDQLPTEQALAGHLGVSRNVVREAMARLRSDGVVQSRQGVGAFLRRTGPAAILRIDVEALRDLREFQSLFELRAILEIRAAGLAARRRIPQAMKELKAALERMRGSEKWEQGGVDADLDFHRAVARGTGNPYLVMVVTFVSEQVRESIVKTRERLKSVAEVVEVTIAEHAAIYDAIREGSPAAARKAMSRHISSAAARLSVKIVVDHES